MIIKLFCQSQEIDQKTAGQLRRLGIMNLIAASLVPSVLVLAFTEMRYRLLISCYGWEQFIKIWYVSIIHSMIYIASLKKRKGLPVAFLPMAIFNGLTMTGNKAHSDSKDILISRNLRRSQSQRHETGAQSTLGHLAQSQQSIRSNSEISNSLRDAGHKLG